MTTLLEDMDFRTNSAAGPDMFAAGIELNNEPIMCSTVRYMYYIYFRHKMSVMSCLRQSDVCLSDKIRVKFADFVAVQSYRSRCNVVLFLYYIWIKKYGVPLLPKITIW